MKHVKGLGPHSVAWVTTKQGSAALVYACFCRACVTQRAEARERQKGFSPWSGGERIEE